MQKTFGKRGTSQQQPRRPSPRTLVIATDDVLDEDFVSPKQRRDALLYKISGVLFALTLVIGAAGMLLRSGDASAPTAAAASSSAPTYDATKAVMSAYAICDVMDATGVTTAPCHVDGGASSIVISAPVGVADARALCDEVVKMSRQRDFGFFGQWKFQIKSPYSGGEPIAWCALA